MQRGHVSTEQQRCKPAALDLSTPDPSPLCVKAAGADTVLTAEMYGINESA